MVSLAEKIRFTRIRKEAQDFKKIKEQADKLESERKLKENLAAQKRRLFIARTGITPEKARTLQRKRFSEIIKKGKSFSRQFKKVTRTRTPKRRSRRSSSSNDIIRI